MNLPLARFNGTHITTSDSEVGMSARENALRLAKEYRAAMDKLTALSFANIHGLSEDERAERDLQHELALRTAAKLRGEWDVALKVLENEQAAA